MHSPPARPVQKWELKKIIEHLQKVKNEGFGEVIITVQNGEVSYVKHGVGEQITMEMKE